ncbi:uncharacterized protein LOC119391062 [Rhipicephalus sanguineus]|uniref:uncharacterized protein LOC119391062 n=1 Tax=Rhipicephalus sanguineus TaxID=34632 RepID=UPI0020C4923A|nr:uncharacterized protein LOC119391062 [Rhipicephalus sanguineus]
MKLRAYRWATCPYCFSYCNRGRYPTNSLVKGSPTRMRSSTRDSTGRLLFVWQEEVTGLQVGHLSVLIFLLQSGVLSDHRLGEGLACPYATLDTWCRKARTAR